MTVGQVIITLVKEGFDYTSTYLNDEYKPDNLQIVFRTTGFNSTPIMWNTLNESHVEQVRKEFKEFKN